MSIPATPPAGEASRNVHVKTLRKRIVTVAMMTLLATSFTLANASTATASSTAAAAPASANSSISCYSAFNPSHGIQECGECPPGTRRVGCFGGSPICWGMRQQDHHGHRGGDTP